MYKNPLVILFSMKNHRKNLSLLGFLLCLQFCHQLVYQYNFLLVILILKFTIFISFHIRKSIF